MLCSAIAFCAVGLKGNRVRIPDSPAAVCFIKRVSEHHGPLEKDFREGAYSGNKSEDLPVHFSHLKLSRKELGTLNIKDVFRIRYFLRFTIRKRISVKHIF